MEGINFGTGFIIKFLTSFDKFGFLRVCKKHFVQSNLNFKKFFKSLKDRYDFFLNRTQISTLH